MRTGCSRLPSFITSHLGLSRDSQKLSSKMHSLDLRTSHLKSPRDLPVSLLQGSSFYSCEALVRQKPQQKSVPFPWGDVLYFICHIVRLYFMLGEFLKSCNHHSLPSILLLGIFPDDTDKHEATNFGTSI